MSMLEVTIRSAKDLKYTWRNKWNNSVFKPFAVAYVNINEMFSTTVAEKGDRCPNWGQTASIRLVRPIDDDTTLSVVIFDAREDGTNRDIGYASLKLKEVVNDVGYGQLARRTLKLRRWSGRSRGEVDVEVKIAEPGTAQPDGQPPNQTNRLRRGLIRGLKVAAVLGNIVAAVLDFLN